MLKRALKLIDLLLDGPKTMKQLSESSGLGLRSTYRYLGVIQGALGHRLISTDKHPRRYWIDR